MLMKEVISMKDKTLKFERWLLLTLHSILLSKYTLSLVDGVKDGFFVHSLNIAAYQLQACST